MLRNLVVPVLAALALLAVVPTASSQREILLFATVGPGPILTLETPALRTVTRLRAGRYYIVVRDRSITRNFHLRGPGVDRRTPVGAKPRAYPWHLRLRPGVYTYQSDPQSRTMKKRFRVV